MTRNLDSLRENTHLEKSHHSWESMSMGAKVTDDLIPEIAEAEPYDIQMAFELEDSVWC